MVLGAAVAAPVLVGYAATVAVLLAVTATAGAALDLAGALRIAAALWPALHQVPLLVGGQDPLGVLPLVPTLLLLAAVAVAAGWASARLGWTSPRRLWRPVAAFAVVHGLLGGAVAAVGPAAAVSVSPGLAIAGCAAAAAVGAAIGAVAVAGPERVLSAFVPAWAVAGVRAGLFSVTALLAAGGAVLAMALAMSATTVHDLYAVWPGGAGPGLTLLSLAYLPNAMIAGLAWLAGPGFSIGAVSVTPLDATGGALPGVPLLAAMPEPGSTPWRALVFVLPLAVGLLAGHVVRARVPAADLTARLHAVVLAGAVAAGECLVLAAITGGRLGGGEFDPVRLPPVPLAVAVFGWIALPAALLLAVATIADRRRAGGRAGG